MARARLTTAEREECFKAAFDYVRRQAVHMPGTPMSDLMRAEKQVAAILISLKRAQLARPKVAP